MPSDRYGVPTTDTFSFWTGSGDSGSPLRHVTQALRDYHATADPQTQRVRLAALRGEVLRPDIQALKLVLPYIEVLEKAVRGARARLNWAAALDRLPQRGSIYRALDPSYYGESVPGQPLFEWMPANGVTYLKAAQRAVSELRIVAGDVFTHKGTPLSTGRVSPWAFVLSPTGRLYAREHIAGVFHHSSFLAGAKVKSAGMIRVQAGRLVWCSNKSGHYKPSTLQTLFFLELAQKRGIDLSRVVFYDERAGHHYRASVYFAKRGSVNAGDRIARDAVL